MKMLTSTTLILPAIFFIFIFFITKWKKSKNSNIKLPPGPKTLPIIGNLHQITSPPFLCLRDLSKIHGPIMHLKLGSTAAIVVSSPEIAKQMLKDHDPIFAGRSPNVAAEIMWYNYADVAFAAYGDYWRQMRKICINELLSPKMVRSFQSIRRGEASRLINSVMESTGCSINLTEKIFSFSSSITCRAAFGGVCRDREGLMKLMMESLKVAGGFQIADFFPNSRIVGALSGARRRLRKMRHKLDVILDDIIDEHKENLAKMAAEKGNWGDSGGRRFGNGEFGGEDLVDVLLRVKEEEQLQFPIHNNNIKAVLYDMFSAGTETSSAAIDWAMVELMRNPNVMAKAQAELRQALKGTTSAQNDVVHGLKYLKLVIKETLRLHPPLRVLSRASREACVISGYEIPANVNVMVNIWAMQRDPRFWKAPEKFVPERFENPQALDFSGGDFQYLPFGSGRRMCPGITFGMATVEMALGQLLYNFDWKLPEGDRAEDLDMVENVGITASRKDNLFVVATPYMPQY